ncbi:MAG TPA: triose-phosphate isomerase [Thermoanaerobaculia bacterium]|nr:triose-phosphate isomerase [Thermoanaerobaculia bacterium]
MGRRPRRPIAAANWKMNLLRADAAAWCRAVHENLDAAPAASDVVVFPGFPLIAEVAAALAGAPVEIGGQDLHPQDKGAHTGDVSAAQLRDAGCAWALCGHSERRHDHGESDATVAAKIAAALRQGLKPMICLGETRDERKAGRTFEVLERQLGAALEVHPESAPAFALAYEPVWAIGTGETATPEIAQEAHRFLRERLGGLIGEERAAAVPILYGGSVTPDNAASLIAEEDVDGFLVGGASLDAEKFLTIIRSSD